MAKKELWITCFLFLLCFFMIPIKISNPINPEVDDQLENDFQQFTIKYNKSYGNDTGNPEYSKRFEIFKSTIKLIDEMNNKRTHNDSAVYGLTEFSDLTPEEFYELRLMKMIERNDDDNGTHHRKSLHFTSNRFARKRRGIWNLPDKIDWRQKNVITSVRDQQQCGSCWAHSVIQTIESAVAIKRLKVKNGTIISDGSIALEALSVQQLIDCAENGNNGCKGGNACFVLEWLLQNNVEIQTMETYPSRNGIDRYSETKNMCPIINKLTTQSTVHITDYSCDDFLDHEHHMLRYLIQFGPIIGGVNAQMWQHYLGGIIQYHCNGDLKNINHNVQIIGYDRTGPIPYYIVRNSWGSKFGNEGYVKIEYGKNVCGIARTISMVQV